MPERLAALRETRGRRYEEVLECNVSNPFYEDFIRIPHSKAFRRLADKTQVITTPTNSYVRSRLTHTQEVVSIAASISEMLGLNTPLCIAAASGHDLGHTPCGHLGESVLSEMLGREFRHNIASVVIAQHLEGKDGKGLNLSYETLQAIRLHSRTREELVPTANVPHEYNVVMWADKIAYTFSDLNDAIRYEWVDSSHLPDFIQELGDDQIHRNRMVRGALVQESLKTGVVNLSEGKVAENFKKTRDYLHHEFYGKLDHQIKIDVLRAVYNFFKNEPTMADVDPALAFMFLTDRDAMELGSRFVESGRCRISDLEGLGIAESLESLRGKKLNPTDPDLDWGKDRTPRPITY